MNESYSPPTRSCTANSRHCLVALQEIIISILKMGTIQLKRYKTGVSAMAICYTYTSLERYLKYTNLCYCSAGWPEQFVEDIKFAECDIA